MSKAQHGNKEAKKPKQPGSKTLHPSLVPALTVAPLAPAAVRSLAQKKPGRGR